MLFEMLTGKPPYTGGAALEIILKHVNEPVPPVVTPSKFEAPPEAFKAIVTRCLAKSPMDRFQSMDELLLAMQDVVIPARAQTQDVPMTEATVAVVAPPANALDDEPIALPQAPRNTNVLLIGGFFLAAVAGVLGTWALVKPATPTKLTFHLESNPAGATVLVDGKSMGVTPIDLEQVLANGRAGIDLRLEKVGYLPSVAKLSANGGRLEFSTTLVPATAPSDVPPPKAVEVKKVEPVAAKTEPEVKKPEPAPKPEPVKAPEVKKAPVVVAKPEPRKKPVKPAEPPGPRPASKLDEDDAPAPGSELKRPPSQ
jgi:serine/threonine-protein kinase